MRAGTQLFKQRKGRASVKTQEDNRQCWRRQVVTWTGGKLGVGSERSLQERVKNACSRNMEGQFGGEVKLKNGGQDTVSRAWRD